MCFWIFDIKQVKIDQKENNAYKELQDAQNAWRYDIQCMKSPTKIERIRSRTKKGKSSTIGTLPHPNWMIVWNESLKRSETRVGRMRTGDAHS